MLLIIKLETLRTWVLFFTVRTFVSVVFPGKYDELAKLLGQGLENEDKLKQLMGDSRAEYERKLKERLACRQRRIDQGTSFGLLRVYDEDTMTFNVNNLKD